MADSPLELAERSRQTSLSGNVDNVSQNHDRSSGHSESEVVGTFERRSAELTLPPVDGGYHAWTFMVAAFIVDALAFVLETTYGVFLERYLKDPLYASQNHANTLLPLIGPLSSGVTYCSGPFLNPFFTRYPNLRTYLKFLGALLCCTSLLGASFVTSVPSLVVLLGATYSVAILSTICLSYMSEWFVYRRGLACGIIFAGTSIAGLFLPLVLPQAIERHGISVTLRYLSIATFCLLGLALPFVRGRLPSSRVVGPAARSHNPTWKYLRSPSMLVVLCLVAVQGFGYFVPILWLPTFGSVSLSPGKSAVSLSLLNGSSVVGRVVMGLGADRFDPWILALFTLGSTSLSTFVFWGVLGYTYTGLIIYGIMYGAFAGSFSSLYNSFLRPIVKDDPSLNSSLLGYILFTRGVSNVLSSPISALLASGQGEVLRQAKTGFGVAGGRYERIIIYTGTCFAGAAAIALASWKVNGWIRRG